MSLVRALKIKYLLADFLCIVQDDNESKQKHLRSMGLIYANSFFTIIAAGAENTNQGMPGINVPDPDRCPPCRIIETPLGPISSFLPYRTAYSSKAIWSSRAWTFQESLFSRRLLVMNGFASWVCGHCTWKEELQVNSKFLKYNIAEGVVLSENRPVLGNMPGWSGLEYWSDLVESYNPRSLTFESDVLDAFASVAEALTHVFPGGFHCGLPEMFFDIALLWQPRNPSPMQEWARAQL